MCAYLEVVVVVRVQSKAFVCNWCNYCHVSFSCTLWLLLCAVFVVVTFAIIYVPYRPIVFQTQVPKQQVQNQKNRICANAQPLQGACSKNEHMGVRCGGVRTSGCYVVHVWASVSAKLCKVKYLRLFNSLSSVPRLLQ